MLFHSEEGLIFQILTFFGSLLVYSILSALYSWTKFAFLKRKFLWYKTLIVFGFNDDFLYFLAFWLIFFD